MLHHLPAPQRLLVVDTRQPLPTLRLELVDNGRVYGASARVQVDYTCTLEQLKVRPDPRRRGTQVSAFA